MIARAIAVAAAGVALLMSGCGGERRAEPPGAFPGAARAGDPGPVHVHGLGINPADGALFIATHTGLFRAGPQERTARRVGDLHQDTMGFTVVGPDRFLGSGHPDLRQDQPPYLGLIASDDAGRTWRSISLLGEADFHVLEAAGRRVVGFGSDFTSRRAQLLVSDDAGRSWDERRPPEPLIDLAMAPADRDLWVASGSRGLFLTRDGGRSWRALRAGGGLLGWRQQDRLYRVDGGGRAHVSADAGRSWAKLGSIGGKPAAFEADPSGLYAAMHDGTIKISRDGGRSWSVRSAPDDGG